MLRLRKSQSNLIIFSRHRRCRLEKYYDENYFTSCYESEKYRKICCDKIRGFHEHELFNERVFLEDLKLEFIYKNEKQCKVYAKLCKVKFKDINEELKQNVELRKLEENEHHENLKIMKMV